MKRKLPPRSSTAKFKVLEEQFYNRRSKDVYTKYYIMLPIDYEEDDLEDLKDFIEYIYEHEND